MKKTIIELLIEWWARNTTTRIPLPTVYTYDVEVDGRTIQIKSTSSCRMYVHYKVRRKYQKPNTSELLVRQDNIDWSTLDD